MKFISWFCLAIFLFIASSVLSQEKADEQQPATNAPVKPGLTTGKPTGDKVLTEDQIAALLTEWTNEKTGTKLVFQSSFGLRTVTPQEKSKYVKSGKIPVRITCELLEVKESGGKKLAKRVDGGTARFYIMDPDGKVIVKKSLSLDKMCPVWGGTGGYFVEVAKEGEYTVVVWVDGGKNRIFGKKLTASLSPLLP